MYKYFVLIFFAFLIAVMSGCAAQAGPTLKVENIVQVETQRVEDTEEYKQGAIDAMKWVVQRCELNGYFILGSQTADPLVIQCKISDAVSF